MNVPRLAAAVICCLNIVSLLGAQRAPAAAQTQPSADAPPLFVRPPAQARRLTYVCDMAGMIQMFVGARRELINTIDRLPENYSFGLILVEPRNCLALSDESLPATDKNKKAMEDFLEHVKPQAQTDALPALKAAFAQKPDVIYFLARGSFEDNSRVLRAFRELNSDHRVQINTIWYRGENEDDEPAVKLLKTIAKENQGEYRRVNESDL